ncbi:MAG: nicotinate-nucleotide adenylyltransferase [Phycisphaerae bacterium]
MNQSLGLYGGSFDPIHFGHLIIARAVAERLGLERVLFLPSADPPHKQAQQLTNPMHRAEMVKLAVAGDPLFGFDDFDLRRAGPTYTLETVKHFRDELGPDAALYWIIGADSLQDLASWHRVGELVDTCTLVTAGRSGWDETDLDALVGALSHEQIEKLQSGCVGTPRIDISATDIRQRLRRGLPVRYLLPESVADYIRQQGLYVAG